MKKLFSVLGGGKTEAPIKCQVIYWPSLSGNILKETTHKRMAL